MTSVNRIIIVDDDPGICHFLLSLLQSIYSQDFSMDIETFTKPSEALEYVKDAHVVVSDFTMWPMSGTDFIREAKKRGSTAQFIIYSAFCDTDKEIDVMLLDEDLFAGESASSFTPVFHKSEYMTLLDTIIHFLEPRSISQ